MFAIKILEVVLFLVLMIFLYTQIVVPGIADKPWFPAFSKKRILENKLSNVKGEVENKELEREIQKEKQKLK